MAISGGQPVNLIGEWDGRVFLPLRIQVDGHWVNLS
jgi:hypothetical protein